MWDKKLALALILGKCELAFGCSAYFVLFFVENGVSHKNTNINDVYVRFVEIFGVIGFIYLLCIMQKQISLKLSLTI